MTYVVTLYAPKTKEFSSHLLNGVSGLLDLYEKLDGLIDYFEGVYDTPYEVLSVVRGG